MSLASDIASVLETLGYGVWGGGTTDGASIYTQHEPDLPAVCTTIYLVGGPPDMLDFGGNTNGERPVQIRMRDLDPLSLETRLESLYALWSAWQRYPAYHLTLKASSKPLYLYSPLDSNVGSLFVASFNVTVIRAS